MKTKLSTTDEQPTWCCNSCGQKFGRWYITGLYRGPHQHPATYHIGICDVCEENNCAVTSPQNFGYLTRVWKKEIRYALGRV